MTFRRRLLLVILLTGVGVVLVMVFWQVLTQPGSREGSASASTAAQPTETRTKLAPALEVLRAWDDRRAEAWALGDVAALARLYVPGSRAGEADCRLLTSYVARGLVVKDMHTQVLSADVREQGEERLVIAVTDRLASAIAVGGGRRTALPRDLATRHTVELARQGGRWLVAEVR